jgi:hypothetical protein
MLRPSTWLDSWRIGQLLRNYSTYSPPHSGDPRNLTLEQGKTNYEYFLRKKSQRFDNLRALFIPFNASLTLDDGGLRTIDAWVHRFCGHLIDQDRLASSISFRTWNPPWASQHAGLNVLWDLGIYAGEFVIHLNSNCSWYLNDGGSHRSAREWTDYLRPSLRIERRQGSWDVFETIFQIAEAKQRLMLLGQSIRTDIDHAPDALEKRIRFYAATKTQ